MPADNSPTRLGYVSSLDCLGCHRSYSLPELKKEKGTIFEYTCDDCFGPLEVRYDLDAVKSSTQDLGERPDTYWKFAELLPANRAYVGENVLFTPLVRSQQMGQELGIDLYFKLDGELPTQSFKDRPVMMAINAALESGDYELLLVGSTGNLAISCAYHAGLAGIPVEVHVPKSLGSGRKNAVRYHLNEHGQLIEEDKPYDAINRAMIMRREELEDRGVRLIAPNERFRPFYKEGSKTNGMEIAWQLDQVEDPERPFFNIYPVGSGALLCASYKGIEQLRELGVTKRSAHMVAVQPETCAPVADAYIHQRYTANGRPDIRPVRVTESTTLAKSIAIGNPGSGEQSFITLAKSSGLAATVTEEQLLDAWVGLYEKEGVFSQDVGGVTVAGVYKLVESGQIPEGSLVVANITGKGNNRIEDDLELGAFLYHNEQNQLISRTRKVLREVGYVIDA